MKTRINQTFCFFCIIFLTLVSCTSSSEKDTSSKSKKNTNKISEILNDNYTEGEILVVIDTSQWSRKLGKQIKSTFGQAVYGLPQPEPDYKLTKIGGNDFGGILKSFRNLLFVVDLSSKSKSDKYCASLLGKKNIDKIINQENGFLVQKDIYFPGQNVGYIVAENEDQLVEILEKKGKTIKAFFDHHVNEFILMRALSAGINSQINEKAREMFNMDVSLPQNFKIAKTGDKFIWCRAVGKEVDRSIYISERPYINEKQFEDSYIQYWKDSVGYLLKADEDSIYIVSQEYMPLSCTVLVSKKDYVKNCSGLWKLTDNSLGGPYTSYIFLNKKRNKIFLAEGFVIAPGRSKRKIVRELNSLISNFY